MAAPDLDLEPNLHRASATNRLIECVWKPGSKRNKIFVDSGRRLMEVRYVPKRKILPPATILSMPRFARAIAVGFPHHVTRRGTDRERVFFTNSDREVYLELLRSSARQASLRILAYCLMPNHVHLVAVPDESDSLAAALRRAHGRYANYLNARRGRTGHLWQNRFYSCALAATHLSHALRYVERNPTRAGLAEIVEQYPWSSAAAHLTGRDPREILDMSFWQDRGGAEDWRSLLATPEELLAVRLLQRGTFTGRPIGNADFIDQLETRSERKLRPRQGVRAHAAAA